MEKKEPRILYDVASVPKDMGINMDTIIKVKKKFGIVLWDSFYGGMEPKIYDEDLEIEVLDVRTANERVKKLLELLEEDDLK